MKQLILFWVLFFGSLEPVFGWGALGHDAVACIASCHLTPRARKNIEKYLHRRLVYDASWMDYYRDTPAYRHTSGWHMARVDSNLCYTDSVRDPDGDAVSALEESIALLSDYRRLDDSTVAVRLKYVIHLVGDLHCPAHVGYAGVRIWYDVSMMGRNTGYHSVWDIYLLELGHPGWGYLGWQQQLDRKSRKERREMAAGTPRFWFEQTAAESRHIYDMAPPGSVLDVDFLLKALPLAERQILRAGYRLARVLNEVFG